jgi:hypothetical protein
MTASRLLPVLLLLGCGLDPEGGLLAADAKQLVRDNEAAIEVGATMAAVTALPSAALTEQTATLADAVAAQELLSSTLPNPGCLTVETTGNEVTYTFDGCAGPWGEVTISGREVVTFAPGADAGTFVVEFASDGLAVDGRPATHGGTAVLRRVGTTRIVEWDGSFEGSTASGTGVKAETSLEITIAADGAASVDGTATIDVGLRSLTADFDSFHRSAPGACPTGVIVVERSAGNLSATLTFDGTTEYVAKTSRGGRGTFTLECTP